ncbi:MAG TPA: hypothetical protein VL147_21060 [Devosia sp.]|nr:hypothetical protein [Devosia sp.]
MSWLQALFAFLKPFLDSFAGLARDAFQDWRNDQIKKQLGYTEAQRDAASQAVDDIKQAQAVRDDLRSGLDADPDSLRDDDGFRRG